MKPGPKPTPAELAALKGNPGHRPITPSADVEQIAEAAPAWLKDASARRIWSNLMPMLRALRFVKATDEIAVGRYCIHLARFLMLNDKLSKKGAGVSYTTVTPHGTMERLHPNFAAMMRTEEALVKLEDRIGLSPAARQQLMVRVAGAGADLPAPGLTDPRNPRPQSSPIGLLAAIHATPSIAN
jgi:P27 family predicted phage terminase small subunit